MTSARPKTAEPTERDETKPQDTLAHSPGPGGTREQEGIRYNGTDGGSEGGRGHGRSEDAWTQLYQEGERGEAHGGVWDPGRRCWPPAEGTDMASSVVAQTGRSAVPRLLWVTPVTV